MAAAAGPAQGESMMARLTPSGAVELVNGATGEKVASQPVAAFAADVASFRHENITVNLLDCMKDGSVDANRITEGELVGLGLFKDGNRPHGAAYGPPLKDILSKYLTDADADITRATWTMKGQKAKGYRGAGQFPGMELAKRPLAGYIFHDAGMLAPSCLRPLPGLGEAVRNSLAQGASKGAVDQDVKSKLLDLGYSDYFVDMQTFGSFMDASESGARDGQWANSTRVGITNVWPPPGKTLILSKSFMGFFGISGTEVIATKLNTPVSSAWDYTVSIGCSDSSNCNVAAPCVVRWGGVGVDPNQDYIAGNKIKNAWVVDHPAGTPDVRQGKIKRIVMKELGDKLQALIYYLFNMETAGRNAPALLTNDQVVFLLCMMLKIRCVYTGVSVTILPARKAENQAPGADKMYAIGDYAPTLDAVARAYNQTVTTKASIVAENNLFLKRLADVVDDPTLIDYAAPGTRPRHAPKGFYAALLRDTQQLADQLKDFEPGYAAGAPGKEHALPHDGQGVSAADIQGIVEQHNSISTHLKRRYLLVDVLGYSITLMAKKRKREGFAPSGAALRGSRAYFSAGMSYTAEHGPGDKAHLLAYMGGLTVLNSAKVQVSVSAENLEIIMQYSMHALGTYLAQRAVPVGARQAGGGRGLSALGGGAPPEGVAPDAWESYAGEYPFAMPSMDPIWFVCGSADPCPGPPHPGPLGPNATDIQATLNDTFLESAAGWLGHQLEEHGLAALWNEEDAMMDTDPSVSSYTNGIYWWLINNAEWKNGAPVEISAEDIDMLVTECCPNVVVEIVCERVVGLVGTDYNNTFKANVTSVEDVVRYLWGHVGGTQEAMDNNVIVNQAYTVLSGYHHELVAASRLPGGVRGVAVVGSAPSAEAERLGRGASPPPSPVASAARSLSPDPVMTPAVRGMRRMTPARSMSREQPGFAGSAAVATPVQRRMSRMTPALSAPRASPGPGQAAAKRGQAQPRPLGRLVEGGRRRRTMRNRRKSVRHPKGKTHRNRNRSGRKPRTLRRQRRKRNGKPVKCKKGVKKECRRRPVRRRGRGRGTKGARTW